MKKIAVSIHAIENFSPQIIKGLNGLDYIHVDVMDGKFVSNKNINLKVFKIIKENYNLPIIAHMMVINPLKYIYKIIKFIDVFIFHYEANGDKIKIINEVKTRNKKVGIAINPDTKISEILPYLDKINIILVMSVYPGKSGQKFLPQSVEKIERLAKYKNVYDFQIDVDGGVNLKNAIKLENADILSSSSTILEAKDPNLVIKSLKQM